MPPPPGYGGYGAPGGGPHAEGPYGSGPYGSGPYGGGPYGSGPYGGGPYGGYRPSAPKPGIIPLRPLTVGDILDGAFTAIRWNPKTILVSSAVVAAISGVLLAIVQVVLRNHVFAHVTVPVAGSQPTAGQLAGYVGMVLAVLGVTILFTFVTNTILTGVLTVAVGQGVLGRKETLGSAWRATRGRLWPLLAMVILKWLFLGGGFLVVAAVLALIAALFVAAHIAVVGIFIAVLGGITALVFVVIIDIRWTVAVPVVMLEHASPLKSLGRSWRLVRKSAWRVWGITLLADLIVGIVGEIIRLPFTFAGGGVSAFTASAAHPSDVGTFVAAIGTILATTVTAPMVAGIIVLLYADLRMRREGMDITLQAAAASPVGQGPVGQGRDGQGPAGGAPGGPWSPAAGPASGSAGPPPGQGIGPW